ncbi:hypothetical protein K431DRAFT_153876 [Polychaeton citri CBS 116435]|uniref:DUF1275 domain protein n=1 Tax=Polychaeton citri CBS 116435 TaxID=1314669 RepID=A0A9P4UKI0_9PEZI|nr:hypothetical protein K431DRAFT_153876 [Polychaeton citri CBS 116435]
MPIETQSYALDHFQDAEAQVDQPKVPTCQLQRFCRHVSSDIGDGLLAEVELTLLTLATGMQDVTTFPDYHCFVSNQTGNTVLLMASVSGLDRDKRLFVPANTGVALVCFVAAVWVVGQLGHVLGDRNRIWLIANQVFQIILVFAAAGLQHHVGVETTTSSDLGVLALLATAVGAQVTISRALKINEISTAMATAAWVDLFFDPNLFVRGNRMRNRRIVFLAALVVGALIGSFVKVYQSSELALVLSAFIKIVVAILLLFNTPGKRAATAD